MNLKKICDLKKSEQTDDIKTQLYNLTRQFVYKYHTHYYPSFKGELDDLISDYYLSFLTEKAREKGKEESLLDKFDPSVTTLPYLVKVAVIRKLIDGERTDKKEKNYVEKYDEETGELSLDFLVSKIDEQDVQLEDIEFSDDEIAELRDKFDEMPPASKRAFLKYYEEVKDVLTPNFKALFEDLVSGTEKSEKKSPETKQKSEKSFADEAVEQFGLKANAVYHNVKGGEAIRFMFESPEALKEAEDNLESLKEYMKSKGYKFYAKRASAWYFVKE